MNKIRVMSCGGLGDVLLSTPVFRAIKERWPGSRTVVYCMDKGHYDVFLHNPYIDSLKRTGVSKIELFPLLALRIGRLNRSRKSSEPGTFGLAKLKSRFEISVFRPSYGLLKPSLFYSKHATEIIAEMIGITLEHKQVMLFITEEEEAIAKQLVSGYDTPIAMHVTSNFTRNQHWPISYWTDLVSRNPQYTFIQLGLPSEQPVPGAVDLRGKIPLRVAFAVLKQVKAFVGVVSAFAHATNAFGTPGVVFYGPSSPLVWGYQNNRNLDVGLDCAPCVDLLGPSPCPYGTPCMRGISILEVERALQQQLGPPSPQGSFETLSYSGLVSLN